MNHLRSTALVLAVLLCPVLASAQDLQAPPLDRSFGIQLFEPAPGQDALLTVESARAGGHLAATVGLVLQYQHNPFSIFRCRGGTGGPGQGDCDLDTSDPWARVVSSHLEADVMASLSIFDMFQFALTIPVTLFQDGDGVLEPVEGEWVTTGLAGGTGLGDIRLHLKWTAPFGLGAGNDSGFGLAIAPVLSFPTGNATVGDAFMGDGTVTVHPQVLLEYCWSALQVAGRIGYRWREESQIYSTELGHHLTYGAGASYTFDVGRPGFELAPVVEIFGSTGFSSEVDVNPLEIDAALRARLAHDFVLFAGAGAGLISAVGVPQFRTFLGAMWAPRRVDTDGDGIRDSDDTCPTEAEDADDFEDTDGCPEMDNDRDGLPDGSDRCPTDPEDVDQFEDEDGCPDADNDGDGVNDGYDACAAEPEDADGFLDEDGCPDLDHDRDNIPTPRDQCPYETEDTDGFCDEDGCPDLDCDLDGLGDDEGDECPDEAEDLDGFEDENGCPDADNDADGFPDESDQCPGRPETLNGIEDDDGCPDSGRTLVVITEEQIQIREQVLFATDSDEIVGNTSFQILDIVTRVLKGRPSLRVRIEGHTDDQGSRDHNVDLSRRRAESVRRYLVSHGIAEDRLEAQGFGPDRPVQSNRSRSGRAANRRVEFHIIPPPEEAPPEEPPPEDAEAAEPPE